MKIKFYNSLTHKKERFIPIHQGNVGLYTCGPTVYSRAHIGNFRTFLFEDVLKRVLILAGFEVNHIMNITDVDDKTINKANEKGISLNQLTEACTSEFMADMATLKILPATHFPTATGHIKEMIEMISRLMENGHAYRTDDGSVFFSIKTYSDYGQLAKLDMESQIQTDRVTSDEYTKDNPQDFALWKSWKEEDGDNYWESPWGKGRPGWHMECSAMSIKYLGSHFDIHCGGVDNIFPHHENEIAQSCCSYGSPFVNIWLHSEHLNIEDEKMSKSLGNILTVPKLIEKGHSPEAVRYALISSHYRTKLSFSELRLIEAKKAIQRINDVYSRLLSLQLSAGKLPDEYEPFINALEDDLNTPKALGILFSFIKAINKKLDDGLLSLVEAEEAVAFLEIADKVFSFFIHQDGAPDEILQLIALREEARKDKQWNTADEIRNTIKEKGWVIEDTTDGTKVHKN